ncbi:hypothetical protein Salat_2737200 [Sesamum alatum]|uniref:Uncharacterized protein n=1 Tax=Sesamum alatum TaxID=300844 RepID=A0AAE1XK13_9LAMI|nr:hypothetical protein Salat_2737200 [Sesamum alatum]
MVEVSYFQPFDLGSSPSGRNMLPMAAPRPGPVPSAWAAPRKLEGRTSASSWEGPGSPARGRLELGWTTVDHSSLECSVAGLHPRLEALPRASPAARGNASSTRAPARGLEHHPRLEPLPQAPRARQLTSSRCLELGRTTPSRSASSWALPAARGAASSTSPLTRGSRQVRRLCPGLEALPRAPARAGQLTSDHPSSSWGGPRLTTPARGASSWALFWLGGLTTLS